jgi:uncharacterized membrane protein YvlD (DUF360 family)
MLYLTSWIVNDFTIDSFWWAILATIIVWAVNLVLEAIFGRDERDRVTRTSDVGPGQPSY